MPAGTKQEPIENVAKLTPKDLAPSQLDFDATNPRLGGDRKRLTQAHIQKILEGEEHLALELVPSLVANGFIPYEPLIVRKVGSRYVVLEGNRRLAAVKHILAKKDQYPAEVVKDLTKIPTLIFKDEGGDQERRIRTYLGVRHLFGFREWPPESKAHFLDQNISSAQDLARIMKEMNLSKGQVMRYLMPVRIMRATGDVLANFEGKDFWVLGEALGRSDIREYIKLVYDPNTFDVKSFDLDKFNYLLEFLYGNEEEVRPGEYSAIGMRRITDTRQLSQLGKVLKSKKGAETLEQGATLQEAAMRAISREEALEDLLDELRTVLQQLISMQPSKLDVNRIVTQLDAFKKAVQSN